MSDEKVEKEIEEVFWDWFLEEEQDFYYDTNREELFSTLSRKLKAIHPSLSFQFSQVQDGGKKEFIITANGDIEAFSYVTNLVERAPNASRWQFIAFKPRVKSDNLVIEMEVVKIGYNDIYFTYNDRGPSLQLTLHIRAFKHTQIEKNALYILLDSLLGEYDAINQIDRIDWQTLDETQTTTLLPFVQLRDIVDRRKDKR